MSHPGIEAIKQMLAATGIERTQQTMAERRAGIEALSSAFPPPAGVAFEAVKAKAVPCEWARAEGCRKDGAILYFHGGGYVIGSIVSHRHLCAQLSIASGLQVLSVDYRLAPEHPYPAAVEDAVTAYEYLLGQGIAPGKIVLAGDSAGGGLTLAALLLIRDRHLPMAGGGMCLSPWADMTHTSKAMTSRAAYDPMVSAANLDEMASHYLAGRHPRTHLASPIFANFKGLPPLYIQVGSDEVLMDDSLAVESAARAAEVPCTVEIWGQMIHVWQAFFPILAEGAAAVEKLGAWAKARTS